MIRYAWHGTDPNFTPDELDADTGYLDLVIQNQFDFDRSRKCAVAGCDKYAFLRCAHCGKHLCIEHFLDRVCFHDHNDDEVGHDHIEPQCRPARQIVSSTTPRPRDHDPGSSGSSGSHGQQVRLSWTPAQPISRRVSTPRGHQDSVDTTEASAIKTAVELVATGALIGAGTGVVGSSLTSTAVATAGTVGAVVETDVALGLVGQGSLATQSAAESSGTSIASTSHRASLTSDTALAARSSFITEQQPIRVFNERSRLIEPLDSTEELELFNLDKVIRNAVQKWKKDGNIRHGYARENKIHVE